MGKYSISLLLIDSRWIPCFHIPDLTNYWRSDTNFEEEEERGTSEGENVVQQNLNGSKR